MFWEQIKKILPQAKGPCIIVEEGSAKYVILNFDEYEQIIKKKANPLTSPRPSEDPEHIEKINQEIESLKEIEDNGKMLEEIADFPSEIQIEDLPIE
ncbi:MAG: hypothetical protein COU81_03315 [Candidatus Portnoybacteria bacterium CG10_big_fil_rev_8_21_14_0_10_36_7]|uniref:Antitoxin n=1 Tax=Candidatus Portnoybacteria bacterium CG10_big_fil_rev_8_21_14_0_10_36_7 TaxID=1974812 RepID=A0A2M8KDE3_9BACT|nr:MAG: hypothetical protein COU81_03315 [Candidatus Portnoybacteria bacterium CG10_big_fil_rev_8_21_14_0_10_36_7]